MRVYTRYDLPDKDGDTRRKRNDRVGIDTPTFEIPTDGLYLWEWFNEINTCIDRIDFNGYYYHIPPSEFLAWANLTRNEILPEEYKILGAMDEVFCNELNAEITAKRSKREEQRKRELEATKSKSNLRR